MSFLSLLSTVTYGPNGIIIPNGYVQTISSNGTAAWTSTLGLDTGLTVSTLRGSTLLSSEFSTKAIGYSTLTGSTLYANSGTVSTLSGSTLVTGSISYSTLAGSTLYANSGTVSTLLGSTLVTGSVSYSTLVGSTLYANSGTVSTLSGSTLVTGSVSYSTLVGSTLYANSGTVSTLLGSTLVIGSIGVSTLTGSTLTSNLVTTSKINLNSTLVALGQSTTQTQANFSEGSYAPGSWITAKSSVVNGQKVAMSSSGQYQVIVSGGSSDLWLSSDSGLNWTALTTASCGLPTLTGSAYWSSGSISASGQQIILSVYGGSLWMSNDFGRTFALTSQATPNIWLQLNGSLADTMGGASATAPATAPGYVPIQRPGYSGQVVNLANTAGGTPTRYLTGSWAGSSNFTVSFWMNAQTVNGLQQEIFTAHGSSIQVYITPSTNYLFYQIPTGGASGVTTGAVTSYSIQANTWYYVTIIFQTNGLCSMYVNNTLIGSATNVGGFGIYTPLNYALGTYDVAAAAAFNGYIADLKIYNSAIPYVPIPLLAPNVWLSFENSTLEQGSLSANQTSSTIYFPFEGSLTDQMGVSTLTTPGSPVEFVVSNREGYPAGQAVRLYNIPGAGADRYINGTWTTPISFTVSGWFNLQSYAASTNQFIFSSGSGAGLIILYISDINTLQLQFPNGTIATGQVISLNTWYYFTFIIQPSGSTCSLYLNNTVYTGTATTNATSSGIFQLGTYNTANAFNGYIDDFRIYNYAITYNPITIQAIAGSLSYVPGVVGLNATSIVNTAGGTASNYLRATCPPIGSDVTVSGWVNLQSFSASGYQIVFAMYFAGIHLYSTDANRTLVGRFPSGSGGGVLDIVSAAVSLNTWYHYVLQFKVNGTCSFYLNGALVGNVTNSGGYGTLTSSGQYAVGTYENSVGNALNGYVDDLRIYNTFIPIHQLIPQNYRSVALSGTGQYLLASAASGHVVGSLDSGATWTKQAVCVGTQGDIVQPNQTGLSSTTWTKNGINYTVSVSSELSDFWLSYYAFNNIINSATWNSATTYNLSGTYTGSVSTTILGGIGPILGEWQQLQSSVACVLSSFSIAAGGYWQAPQSYYIVGSNDAANWYPIQYGIFNTNPYTTNYGFGKNNIIINLTGIQTYVADITTTITTTSYSTSTSTYLYFRIIYPSIHNGLTNSDVLSIGELYLNFAKPSSNALALSHSGQYQMVATGPAAGSVMPNQSGLASNTWSQGGIQWGSTASSFLASLFPYGAFNNYFGNVGTYSWASTTSAYNTSSGIYVGSVSTTILGGIGAQLGEWLQLQSSVPLVLTSYTYGCGGFINLPKTYYIVGSMDGSNWYPLQYVAMTLNPLNVNSSVCSSYITTNTTGPITIQGQVTGTGTGVSYSFATQPWMFFRFIGINIWNTQTNAGAMEFGELYLNFQNSLSYSNNYGGTWSNTVGTVSNEIVSLSPSGQYSVGANTVAPFARLTLDGTSQDSQGALVPATGAGTVTYSSSVVKVGSQSAFFNNTAGSGAANYLNYTVPAVLNTPSALTMVCWVYRTQSGDSSVMMFANGTTNGNQLYFDTPGYLSIAITTTNQGAGAYPSTGVIVPLNTWVHVAYTYRSGELIVYLNGANVYSSSAYTGNLILLGTLPITNLVIGGNYSANYAYAGYVDDVRLYTQALSAHEIAALYSNPALTQSIGVSNSYLPISSYTKPVLPGATANVVGSAVSQSGQYMVAVTSGVTNNVYYSTDYGSSFNALTIGASSASTVTPLARLSLDNTNVDSQAALTPATGAGTVTYSNSIMRVGSHSAYFNNTAGAAPANYLNYTVPVVLNTPSALTMACWVYPTAYPSSGVSMVCALNSGNYVNGVGTGLAIRANGIYEPNYYTTTTNGPVSTNVVVPLNTWTHLSITYNNGLYIAYVNGVSVISVNISGNLSTYNGNAYTNFLVGCWTPLGSEYNFAFQGYVDDVRLYTSALSAGDVYNLYAAPPMTSCAISHDGSYLTVANASTVYTLNRNSKGFTLAVGSQAGAVNQASNAIAIGNKAGQMNQSANSIVINATGSSLNTGGDGCYVAPISVGSKSSSTALTLLGYGADSQVVQTGITVQNRQQFVYGEWIQQQLGTPQPISGYAIMNRNGFVIQCPTAWYILGSVDGINWDLLDYQRNITNTPGAIYSLPSLTPVYSYYRFVISQINRSSSSLSSNVAAYADIGGFVLYRNGSPLFSAPTATNALAPYTLSGPYSNILQSNGVILSTITFSWLPIGQSVYGIGFDGAIGSYNMGLIAVSNGHLNTTAASGTFLGFYITVASFGSTATSEYDINAIAFQGTSTPITSPSLSLSGTTSIEGTLAVSGGFSASIDLIAQGPYLVPSPENRDTIIQWLQKTVGTVTPVTGVSPFWASSNTNSFGSGPAHGAGQAAYVGGVLLSDGRIVCVPANGTAVGLYNPITNLFTTGAAAAGSNAYYTGILLPDGRVVFTPHNSSTVGIYNPLTNILTNGPAHGQGTYTGSVLLPNGNVLFVPHAASVIGIYNPTSNTFTTGPAHGQVAGAYYGGVLLPDGRVVLVPQASASVGIYNYVTNTFSASLTTGGGFSGGVLLSDGRVLFVPYTNTVIVIYNPMTNTSIVGPSATGYYGGVLLPDGRVLLVPISGIAIAIYNPVTNTLSTGPTSGGGHIGGLLIQDGRVILIPYGGSTAFGIYNTNLNPPREMCLHPFFNKF